MSEHELWNELGNLYYLSGSCNQAIYAYNRSIQMENRFGRPYSNLALTYVHQGKYAEAVKLYETGIELLLDDKEKAITWYRLGDVYRCLKDYRDAILAYQQGDLLDPTLSQDSKELGGVLYGASGISSASELPQSEMTKGFQKKPAPSASDSLEVDTPSLVVASSSPVQQVEPEPVVAEKLMPTLKEPKTNLHLEPPVLQEETKESAPAEEQPVPVFEDDFFPMLFEEEPLQEIDEEETGDWLYYFGSEIPEPIVTQAVPEGFSNREPVAITPILNPVPAVLNSDGFSRILAQETQLEILVRSDFQNVAVVETKEPLPLILEVPDVHHQESAPGMKEITVANACEQEAFVDPSATISNDTELEIGKIKQILEADPNNAIAWQNLGDLHKSAKMYKDAIGAYQQAISIDPKNIDYRHRLGISYAIEGRVEEAIRTFQEILKLNPSHGLAHATLSGYYRKMGLEELAQKHIKIAMKNIYDSENEYNQACLQALCGNVNEAIALLRVALETKRTFVDWVLRDPDLDGIRSDPRFKQLISDFM